MTIDFTHALSGIFSLGLVLLAVSSAGIVFDAVTNMANERARRQVEMGAHLQHA